MFTFQTLGSGIDPSMPKTQFIVKNFGTTSGTQVLSMVSTRNQDSDFEHQEEDSPLKGSEGNIVGHKGQDSLGVTSNGLSLQLVPLMTQGQHNHMELMGVIKGGLRSLDGFAKKIGTFHAQPPPPLVVLESSKLHNSNTPRVERYVASSRKEVEFGQSSKGKKINGFPQALGARPSQVAPKRSQIRPLSV